ncbi:MAG: fimbria/pilus periplasmic chaperone [Bryobacteraceae bacterium]
MALRSSTTLFGLLLFAGGLSLQAGSYAVKPVRIELSSRQLRTTFQVENLGDEPVTVQAHVVAWNANGGEEIQAENDEILLNPPIFSVLPGHQQYIRLGMRKPRPDTSESTFRLILEEVPPAPKPGVNGLRTLLRISVPIFFKPKVSAPHLVWSAKHGAGDGMVLSVSNSGNAHVQIRRFSVTDVASGAVSQVQGSASYVLQQGKKEWTIHNSELANATKIVVQAQTDNGDIHEELVPSP